jgi:hypothetical protein
LWGASQSTHLNCSRFHFFFFLETAFEFEAKLSEFQISSSVGFWEPLNSQITKNKLNSHK